ncbi:MAG TPA: efflux RND transporter periplasmic adaptor subunit [Gemmatimonadales bacterium]|nr:efflux RND transporter periplasmic adaptor subunit [Gemmatimonadales bacterium]
MRPALGLLLLVAGCGGGQDRRAVETAAGATVPAAPAAAPEAVIATAESVTVDRPLTLPSQLYVEHDAAVIARSSGVVEAILADIGTRVEAGQPLARLESTDQEIALAQARERSANASLRVERQRALTTAGVVTRADSEQVEFEHRDAELALRKAQRDYDLTRIAAPFAGVVTARMARVERLVSPGDSLFRVTALAPVLASVRVPEGAAGALRVGATARVLTGGGVAAAARVIRASPVLDAASGTREVVLQLSSATGMTPGSAVTVQLGAERRRVVAIPRAAVARDGYVLVSDDGRTTLRAVTLGAELDGDRVEVVSGIAAGEKVARAAP